MRLPDYLGSPVSLMLASPPFMGWRVERSIEEELARIHYVFAGNGLAVSCDNNETVKTIFLCSDEYGGFDESLFEIPFSLTRDQVLSHFDAAPSRSGEKDTDPVLGEYGAWDRFSRPGVEIHVEYRPDADEICQITLMCDDVAP